MTGFVLGREWVEASRIREATGWSQRKTQRVLDRLQRRELVERTIRADGVPLWRRTDGRRP
ncbi:MAG TPA: hypothetical protein VNS09_26345 [Solirubrobacter sp.]|nr:hypothetical protein [Solirubrobacter sp.]